MKKNIECRLQLKIYILQFWFQSTDMLLFYFMSPDQRNRLYRFDVTLIFQEHMDSGGGVPGAKNEKKMKVYVDNMLKDITMSHKEREDQLSHAAQQYREQKRKFAHKYEELLVAYR